MEDSNYATATAESPVSPFVASFLPPLVVVSNEYESKQENELDRPQQQQQQPQSQLQIEIENKGEGEVEEQNVAAIDSIDNQPQQQQSQEQEIQSQTESSDSTTPRIITTVNDDDDCPKIDELSTKNSTTKSSSSSSNNYNNYMMNNFNNSMKKFNNLLPKFRSNKLEPLSYASSSSSSSSTVNNDETGGIQDGEEEIAAATPAAPPTITVTAESDETVNVEDKNNVIKIKKTKRSKKSKLASLRKITKQPQQQQPIVEEVENENDASEAISPITSSTPRFADSGSGSGDNIVDNIVGEVQITEITDSVIPLSSSSLSPMPEIVDEQISRSIGSSKVIFAVPQTPGKSLIAIPYNRINGQSISNGRKMYGNAWKQPLSAQQLSQYQNGYHSANAADSHTAIEADDSYAPLPLTSDMPFEVVWNHLTYYHESVAKKLAKEAKAAEKSGGEPKSGSNNKAEKNVDRRKSTSNGSNRRESEATKQIEIDRRRSSSSRIRRRLINVRKLRPALNDVSGSFRSGQITAIMGPSGAGKTVLLNVITGHLPIGARRENSGTISVNGVKSLRIGFVEQFDHLLPHLSVRETLLFASRIKNAARYYLNHDKIVQNVIAKLDLTDCETIYASHCSNGQRKRLSIAIELCFNSDILILDEPTTGLDAVTGFQIMDTLKSLANRRKTIAIVATIHQPSPRMFELFDNLIVLSNQGSVMYQGGPQGLPRTLLLVGLTCPMYSNISDFMLEVASGEFGRQNLHMLAHYNAEHNRLRYEDDINEVECTSFQEAVKSGNKINKKSFVLCTWLLLVRSIWCNWRNPFNTRIRFVSMLFCALFLGAIFTDTVGEISTCPPTKYTLWRFKMEDLIDETSRQQQHAQENLAVIFMSAVVSLFNSMLNTVVTFPIDLAVFRREYNNYSYSLLSFYVAKVIADSLFTLPSTGFFVVIVHRLTGQIFDQWSRLLFAVIPCLAVTGIGQFVGMTLAVIFEFNLNASVYSVILIIIPIIMFSGFFRLVSEMNWYMARLSYVSFLKNCVNSMMIAIYGLERCEHEDRTEYERFVARNITEAQARPDWIRSMSTLIDYQLTLSESNDPNMLALKSETLESEDKLVRYMGLNMIDLSAGATDNSSSLPAKKAMKQALVLAHFDIYPDSDSYWHEIYMLLDYIALFAVTLFVIMQIKFTRKN